ncbi:MAG: gliding motility-associated C-terminal domain-containing protein, partial [Chitinophagaceae bacterium]|nr:gliding motility-associated C-terminal domain-containing protein [Chitinophagaceae bacterium]
VYTVTAADANCSILTTITINQAAPILINNAGSSNPSCIPGCDGSLTAAVAGGVSPYSYAITGTAIIDAAGVATGMCSGTIYTITVTDANLCTGTASFQLISQNAPGINVVNKTDISCSGICDGTLTVAGSGGVAPYAFSIAPAATQPVSGSFTNLCGGNYTVTVTDANGCTQNTVVNIVSPPPSMLFTTVNIHNVYCNSEATGSVAVIVSGGSGIAQFSISPAATQFPAGFFKDLKAATYTITATDANGCAATTSATVTENPALRFTSITMQHPVCSYDSTGVIAYTATGGTSPLLFSLNDGLPHVLNSFNGLKSGTYKLKIIDDLGCSKDTFLTLTAASPVAALITTTEAFCVDSASGRADITGIGGYGSYRYFVTPGLNINKTGTFYNLTPGTYTLRVVDTLGCEYATTFAIAQPANPLSVSISKQDLACHGKGNEGNATANVSGGTPPYVYEWSSSPVQNTATADHLYFGNYQVKISDGAGCQLSDTVYIQEGPCCDIAFIPNAFTPNGDQLNDEFVIYTTAGVELIQLEIYDRWGQRVYSSSDWRRGWDGNIDGKPAAVATYFYVYKYKCTKDGENYLKKGDVLLIR